MQKYLACIREVLSWIKERGHKNVMFESEALNVARAILNGDPDLSSFDLIVEDCRELLKSVVRGRLNYIRRSTNFEGHCAARAAGSMLGFPFVSS